MRIITILPVLALAISKPTLSVAHVFAADEWDDLLTTTTDLQPPHDALIQRRASVPRLSTCGFLNGDPSKPRTADAGFDCRVDARNGLWGFCPTSVMAASDCGLAGSCLDDHECSSACGFTDKTRLTTFTWYVNCFLLPLRYGACFNALQHLI